MDRAMSGAHALSGAGGGGRGQFFVGAKYKRQLHLYGIHRRVIKLLVWSARGRERTAQGGWFLT